MNLYEISATLENGAVHKTKIYEINQERALNRASKFALQFDATGCAKKTVQLIRKNAGVSKDTERAFLNEIKEILEGLGENSYCAMRGGRRGEHRQRFCSQHEGPLGIREKGP